MRRVLRRLINQGVQQEAITDTRRADLIRIRRTIPATTGLTGDPEQIGGGTFARVNVDDRALFGEPGGLELVYKTHYVLLPTAEGDDVVVTARANPGQAHVEVVAFAFDDPVEGVLALGG